LIKQNKKLICEYLSSKETETMSHKKNITIVLQKWNCLPNNLSAENMSIDVEEKICTDATEFARAIYYLDAS